MLHRAARLPRRALRLSDRTLRRALSYPLLSEGTPRAGLMASVVMADDGAAFDGRTAETGPLGGAETAFAALAEALAGRGHQVMVRNRCCAALLHKGVLWAPLSAGVPTACDLYIG